MRALFAWLIVLSVGAPLAMPGAGAAQNLPLAYHLQMEGDGWFVLNLSAVGAASITLEQDPGPRAAFAQVMFLSDQHDGPSSMTLGRSDSTTWASADATADTPGVTVRVPSGSYGAGSFERYDPEISDIRTLIVWGAGGEWFSVRIYSADPNFAAGEVARGDRAWIWDGSDWDSPNPIVMANVGIHHVAHVEDATRAFEIQGRFAGIVGWDKFDGVEWEETIRVEKPDGTMLNCYCLFAIAANESFSLPPGRYVLHRDAHGVAFEPTTVLAGADIQWP